MYKIQILNASTGEWEDLSTDHPNEQLACDTLFAIRMNPSNDAKQYKVMSQQ